MEIHSIRETTPQQIMLEITNQEESVFFFFVEMFTFPKVCPDITIGN